MKKNLVLLILVLLFIIPGVANGEKGETIIKINGVNLNTDGIAPYIKDGTTFVPLRAISEVLGYDVKWDGVNQIVNMEKGSIKVKLPIGKATVSVNGKNRDIAQPANIIKGTTYLPVRFVSEVIGYEVNYHRENGKSIISIGAPPVEVEIDKGKADKFVNDYVKSKGYSLIQYSFGDVTGDSNQDYVLLVDSGRSIENDIILIDGKSEVELGRVYVIKGSESASIEVKRITGENKKQIYYHGSDGYVHEYIFNYDSGGLKNIYRDIEGLKDLDGVNTYRYFIDYPSLNKVIHMGPAEKIVYDISIKGTYDNPSPKMDESFGYKTYIEKMDTPGEITVLYELKFFPTGNDTKGELRHTYRWNNGKWDIKDVKSKTYDKSLFVFREGKYSNQSQYSSWSKNGVLNISKDNVDSIFNASRNEMLRINGKPNKIDVLPYGKNIIDYIYKGHVVRYQGGSDKYPWGPSQINFDGGSSTALGIKVGTKFSDLRKKLGKASWSDDEEGYVTVYEAGGYSFFFLGGNANDIVRGIYVKER